jgi:polygalacturonase
MQATPTPDSSSDRPFNGDPRSSFNVHQFGALGDGVTLDTDAINRCIEAATKAGGGTVYFPPGKYLSFSIRLQSHVELRLSEGATIIAAKSGQKLGAYDEAEPNQWGDVYEYQDFGHSHWHNSLMWGETWRIFPLPAREAFMAVP